MLPNRWDPDNFQRTLENPRLLERELRIWFSKVTEPLYRFRQKRRYSDGLDVMEKDWDNLILLDACRFDYFENRNPIPGELQSVTSMGSTSSEFIESNFIGRNLHDTIYVTANPYVEMLSEDVFYSVENLLVDQWQTDPGTVPPDAVRDAAVEANERNPNKRLIIHFMQPHTPYLGPTATEIRERFAIDDAYNRYQCVDGADVETSGYGIHGAAMQGLIPVRDVRQAYSETLDIVLDSVTSLLSQVDGKSVVTADHGELLGERFTPLSHRRYGHPSGSYARELRVVPWLQISCDTRRRVVSEAPVGFERLDETTARDRLQALGYLS